MKAAVLIGAVCTWLMCSGQAQAPADDLTIETLLKLNEIKISMPPRLCRRFRKKGPLPGKSFVGIFRT